MAKHCTNCGHELSDSDKFCAECGTAVGGTAPAVQPVQWETCEISYETVKKRGVFSGGQIRFVAIAVGPLGRYLAAASEAFDPGNVNFPYEKYRNHVAYLNALIGRLTSEGWESVGGKTLRPAGWAGEGGGENWYGYKFHRQVRR